MPRRLPLQQYVDGILRQDVAILSRAITVIESRHPQDQPLAEQILSQCMSHTGRSLRIGITGVPGVGKSTLLEAFGMLLVEQGLRVAVLAIDPSSSRTGGSILGDKTRMEKLAMAPDAFIRPSPTDTHLGGVARKTRETMYLCEAAGYDVVMVESVGVGQSEILLAKMVDCFVALMLPNAGDELQGIKKGLLEWVDILVVNKADGPNQTLAKLAEREYRAALHYRVQRYENWVPPTLCVSGLEGRGLKELWQSIQDHQQYLKETEQWTHLRLEQQRDWFVERLQEEVWSRFLDNPDVQMQLPLVEAEILRGQRSVREVVQQLIHTWETGAMKKDET